MCLGGSGSFLVTDGTVELLRDNLGESGDLSSLGGSGNFLITNVEFSIEILGETGEDNCSLVVSGNSFEIADEDVEFCGSSLGVSGSFLFTKGEAVELMNRFGKSGFVCSFGGSGSFLTSDCREKSIGGSGSFLTTGVDGVELFCNSFDESKNCSLGNSGSFLTTEDEAVKSLEIFFGESVGGSGSFLATEGDGLAFKNNFGDSGDFSWVCSGCFLTTEVELIELNNSFGESGVLSFGGSGSFLTTEGDGLAFKNNFLVIQAIFLGLVLVAF